MNRDLAGQDRFCLRRDVLTVVYTGKWNEFNYSLEFVEDSESSAPVLADRIEEVISDTFNLMAH